MPTYRPDWRDPNMKVVWRVYDENKNVVVTYVDKSHREERSRKQVNDPFLPSWNHDPSYFWNKKGQR